MQIFKPTPKTVHWGYYDSRLEPIGELESGEEFGLQSTSGLAWDPESERYVPEEARTIHREVTDKGPGVHIMTGPLAVKGALPGDVLQLDILDVRLRADHGYSVLDPLQGIYRNVVAQATRWIVPIDRAAGRIEVYPGAFVDARPFFGNIGVAPPAGYGRIGSAEPRIHGGNLDLRHLGSHSTLFLPVHVPGALLSIGDGHAVQGDGEVCLTAVETPLEGDFRVRVRRDFSIELPIALTSSHLITLAFHEDLDEAARLALRQLLRILEEECGVPFNDGLRLASFAVDLHVTQVVNHEKGVHAMIARDLLAQLPNQPRCLS